MESVSVGTGPCANGCIFKPALLEVILAYINITGE